MSSRIAQSKRALRSSRYFLKKKKIRASQRKNVKSHKNRQVIVKPKPMGKSELLMVPPLLKPNKLYTPIVMQTRIFLKHIMGTSLRKIAREEGKDVGTVARILAVHADQELAYAASIRELYLGLAPAAIACKKVAIENGDVHEASEVLRNVGIPSGVGLQEQGVPSHPLLNVNLNMGQAAQESEEEAFSRLLEKCSPSQRMRLEVLRTMEVKALAHGYSADTVKLPEPRPMKVQNKNE